LTYCLLTSQTIQFYILNLIHVCASTDPQILLAIIVITIIITNKITIIVTMRITKIIAIILTIRITKIIAITKTKIII